MPVLVFLFILGTLLAAVSIIPGLNWLLLVAFACYLPTLTVLAIRAGQSLTKDLK